MNAIKELFKRRKFKAHGPAHRLNESSNSSENRSESENRHRFGQTSQIHKSKEAERAGAAAIERIQQQQQQTNLNWSTHAIKNQAKRELEKENSKENKEMSAQRLAEVKDVCPNLTVSGVYFTCPIIGPEVLPKKEVEERIRSFLYEQLQEERGLTACLIIHTLNKNKILVQKGVETLARYLTNIIDQPTEEKYRKIRLGNKVFQERVANLEGATDFLIAAGFSKKKLKSNDEEEEYFVLEDENLDIEQLQTLKEAILSAEPLKPELDRNLKVLKPVAGMEKINLPDDFYNLTLEEIKKEQQYRTETVEKLSQLRTKEMRERESQGRQIYRYALIRVRFPDGIILQGTFSVHETFSAVKQFVVDNLMDPTKEFELSLPADNKKLDETQTLLELKLVPAVSLHYKPVNEDQAKSPFLNYDCMSLLSDL